MGAGESGVTEIQAQIDDAVQGQIQQAISEAVPQTTPPPPEDKDLKKVIEIQTEVLNKLASKGQQGVELDKKKLMEILKRVRTENATGSDQKLNNQMINIIKNEITSLIQKQIADKKNVAEFVMPSEIIGDLGKLCKRLEKVKEEKKENYQINNSDEISGFNLKMK